MIIELRRGLPYVTAAIEYRGQQAKIENVLLGTGSAGCIIAADSLLAIGPHYEPLDLVQRIRGAGGTEFVFAKNDQTHRHQRRPQRRWQVHLRA